MEIDLIFFILVMIAVDVWSCIPTNQPDFPDFTTTTSTTTTTTTTTTALICPSGYSLEADGRCWMFGNLRVRANTAENLCQIDGAHLATIHNQQQQDILISLIPVSTPPLEVWIGTIRTCATQVDSCFAYIDDNSPITYSNWRPGQPDDATGMENCVYVNGGPPWGSWDDQRCLGAGPPKAPAVRYMCVIEPTVSG